MARIDPVLGYFVLKFAPGQNMPQSSLYLELNFVPVSGYFLRGEKCPDQPQGIVTLLPRVACWIISFYSCEPLCLKCLS